MKVHDFFHKLFTNSITWSALGIHCIIVGYKDLLVHPDKIPLILIGASLGTFICGYQVKKYSSK